MKSLIQYGSSLVLVALHHGISALVGHSVSIPEAIFGGLFFGVIGVMLRTLYEAHET
jgi:hypothetical protein